MIKTRIILLVLAVAAIVALYSLPRMVVENEADMQEAAMGGSVESGSGEAEEPSSLSHIHNNELDKEAAKQIDALRSLLESSENQEKSVIFADSLAEAFKKHRLLDSAAYYKRLKASMVNTEAATLEAANAYLEALSFAMNEDAAQALKSEARKLYNSVLENNPEQLEAKANLAMTYVGGKDPMKGIAMLQEVIRKDPDNKTALFNLGVLSITSNQFDKAIGRFTKLIELDSTYWEAHLYLGYAYLNTNRKDEAKEQFDTVKEGALDPELQAAADNYLKFINN